MFDPYQCFNSAKSEFFLEKPLIVNYRLMYIDINGIDLVVLRECTKYRTSTLAGPRATSTGRERRGGATRTVGRRRAHARSRPTRRTDGIELGAVRREERGRGSARNMASVR